MSVNNNSGFLLSLEVPTMHQILELQYKEKGLTSKRGKQVLFRRALSALTSAKKTIADLASKKILTSFHESLPIQEVFSLFLENHISFIGRQKPERITGLLQEYASYQSSFSKDIEDKIVNSIGESLSELGKYERVFRDAATKLIAIKQNALIASLPVICFYSVNHHKMQSVTSVKVQAKSLISRLAHQVLRISQVLPVLSAYTVQIFPRTQMFACRSVLLERALDHTNCKNAIISGSRMMDFGLKVSSLLRKLYSLNFTQSERVTSLVKDIKEFNLTFKDSFPHSEELKRDLESAHFEQYNFTNLNIEKEDLKVEKIITHYRSYQPSMQRILMVIEEIGSLLEVFANSFEPLKKEFPFLKDISSIFRIKGSELPPIRHPSLVQMFPKQKVQKLTSSHQRKSFSKTRKGRKRKKTISMKKAASLQENRVIPVEKKEVQPVPVTNVSSKIPTQPLQQMMQKAQLLAYRCFKALRKNSLTSEQAHALKHVWWHLDQMSSLHETKANQKDWTLLARLDFLMAYASHAAWSIEQAMWFASEKKMTTHNLQIIYRNHSPSKGTCPNIINDLYLANHWTRYFYEEYREWHHFTTLSFQTKVPPLLEEIISLANQSQTAINALQFEERVHGIAMKTFDLIDTFLPKGKTGNQKKASEFFLNAQIPDNETRDLNTKLLDRIQLEFKGIIEKENTTSGEETTRDKFMQTLKHLELLKNSMLQASSVTTYREFASWMIRSVMHLQHGISGFLTARLFRKTHNVEYNHEVEALAKRLQIDLSEMGKAYKGLSQKTRYPSSSITGGLGALIVDQCTYLRYDPLVDQGFKDQGKQKHVWLIPPEVSVTSIVANFNKLLKLTHEELGKSLK